MLCQMIVQLKLGYLIIIQYTILLASVSKAKRCLLNLIELTKYNLSLSFILYVHLTFIPVVSCQSYMYMYLVLLIGGTGTADNRSHPPT